jgi:hypothetical protein
MCDVIRSIVPDLPLLLDVVGLERGPLSFLEEIVAAPV